MSRAHLRFQRRANGRGVTLIETCFALTILVTVIVASCMVISASSRHAAMRWEDMAANEFADSVLEHVMAEKSCSPTDSKGRAIGSVAGDPIPATGIVANLTVTPSASDAGVVDVSVAVTWQREMMHGLNGDARVERKLRRRAQR